MESSIEYHNKFNVPDKHKNTVRERAQVSDDKQAQTRRVREAQKYTARANVSPVVNTFWSLTLANKQKLSGKHLGVDRVRAVWFATKPLFACYLFMRF